MSDIETPYVNINKVADYFKVSYLNIGEVYRFRLDDVEAALTAASKEAQVSASITTINDGE